MTRCPLGTEGCEADGPGINATPHSVSCDSARGVFVEVNSVLHALWGKAVGTPEYDKAQWSLLQSALSRLLRDRHREGFNIDHWVRECFEARTKVSILDGSITLAERRLRRILTGMTLADVADVKSRDILIERCVAALREQRPDVGDTVEITKPGPYAGRSGKVVVRFGTDGIVVDVDGGKTGALVVKGEYRVVRDGA